MDTKILKFDNFKNAQINEGLYDKTKEFIKGVFTNVMNTIKQWIIPRKINKGIKKGAMTINYIDPKGDVLQQLDAIYAGTEFVKIGRLQPNVIQENLTRIYDFKILEAQNWKEYPQDDPSFEAPMNVNAKQFKQLIKMQYNSTKRDTTVRSKPKFFFGAPGIGKTQLVAQVAKELGIGLIIFEVANMESSDFKGLGTPASYLDDESIKKRGLENSKDSLVYLRSRELFPTKETSENGGIIFMDEFVNADEDVIKKLNLFIQSGGIDEYKLPHNWIIIGAGNRPGDQDDIYDFKYNMPAADRWTFYHFVPQPSDWIDWARDNNVRFKKGEKIQAITKGAKVVDKDRTYILPDVIDLIEIYEDIFYNLDKDKNPLAYASPRAWEFFSLDIQDACELEGIDIDEWYMLDKDQIQLIANGHVGKQATNVLISYIEVRKYLDKNDIMQIFSDPMNAIIIPGIHPKDSQSDSSKIKSLSVILIKALDVYANGNNDKIIDGFGNMLEYILRYEIGEGAAFMVGLFQKEFPILNKKIGSTIGEKDPQLEKLRNIINKTNSSLKNINNQWNSEQ